MFGEEEEEEQPKRKLIKLQYTEEEQRAMEAAQKQVDCHLCLPGLLKTSQPMP